MTKRAFIFGSQYWNDCPKPIKNAMEHSLNHVIDNIIKLGHTVSVGDGKPNQGIDTSTINYLNQNNYHQVVISGTNNQPQNPIAANYIKSKNWQYEKPNDQKYPPTYTYNTETIRKDRHLVDQCNYGIGVIDQKSNFNQISQDPIRNLVRLMDQKQNHPDQYNTCYLIYRQGNRIHETHLKTMQDLDQVMASYKDPQTTKQYNLIKQEELRQLHPDQYNRNFNNPSAKTKLLMTFSKNHKLSYKAARQMISNHPEWTQPDFKPTFENMQKSHDPIFDQQFNHDQWTNDLAATSKAVKIAKQNDIAILAKDNPKYPQKLKTTATQNYPNVIYAKGDLNSLNTDHAVAIVGTTNPYHKDKNGHELPQYQYGAGGQIADKYSQHFGQHNYAIVTGLAAGIDTIATRGALKQNAPTVAIVSNPLEQGVYPYKNQNLYDELSQDPNNHGVVISTEMPGANIPFYNAANRDRYSKSSALIARDEWQSGMSDAVIAVEESAYTNKNNPNRFQPGGTRHAMENGKQQGRLVAVPDFNQYFGKGHVPKNFSYTQLQVDQFKVTPLNNQASLDHLMHQIETPKRTKAEQQAHDHEFF